MPGTIARGPPLTATPTIDARPDGSTVQSPAPRAADAPDVLIQRVTKRFDTVTAVDHMDLSIERASSTPARAVRCGKTTTLRMIAGFEQADEEMPSRHEPIAGVPPYQRNVTRLPALRLFPHRT